MAIASPNNTTLDGKADSPPLVKGSVKRLEGWVIPAIKVANLGLVSRISSVDAMLARSSPAWASVHSRPWTRPS